MKPIIVTKRWWSPPYGRWSGLCVYPFVFVKRPCTERRLRHELIHWWEVERGWWLVWYARWLWQRWRRGYGDVDAEVRAYMSELDPFHLPPRLERVAQEQSDG